VTLLGIGLAAACALALVVVVDVSAAFLQRRQLVAAADAAALAGAQSIDLAAYYRDGASSATRLDPAAVAPRVRAQVGRSAAASIEGLTIDRISSDGVRVVVALSAPLRLPFAGEWLGDRVRVESSARLAYRENGTGAGPYP
jgi:uncharacterized membrane protein